MLHIYANIQKCHLLIGKRLIIFIVNDINSLLITGHGHYLSAFGKPSYDGLKTRMQSATPVNIHLKTQYGADTVPLSVVTLF